jgi:acyl carrier protein
MQSEIEQRIGALIAAKFNIDANEITPATSLKDLQADSLDSVELLIEIEREFGIDIPDEDAERWSTVREMSEYIWSALDQDTDSHSKELGSAPARAMSKGRRFRADLRVE